MRRTIVIVVGVLAVTLAFSLVMTRRLISTWHPEHTGTAEPSAHTSGAGLILEFSDKPVPLPDLALIDLSGAPIDQTGWKGKVILVNFWATWCGPCREEIPDLIALQERYANQLVVVGLSIDTGPVEEVKAFADRHHVNYPVSMVGEAVVTAFGGVQAVPATFVVDSTGHIVQRHIGRIDEATAEHEIRALAGLPTDARVERVADTGQVLLANAAYATSIPGVDFTGHRPASKELALAQMNTEHCSCACGLTVAQCRIQDPACEVSLPQARGIAARALTGR
jgi:thiol-disulfide isomerase/thioredoxin